MKKPPITATLTWQGDLKFRAATPRTEIILDSDSTAGPSPPEALAMALAGCMAIDVADIVIKGRHPLTALEVRIAGERRDDPPRRFVRFTLHFLVGGDVPAARDPARDCICRATSTARCGTRCGRTSRSTRRSRSIAARRKVYLDWLRGIAVIIMVGAHVTDAWTRQEDRSRTLYMSTVFIAGLAAPLFLFLAGLDAVDGGIGARGESRPRGGGVDGALARPADVRAGVPVPAAVAAARLGRARSTS